jgi:hypothetical protein
MRDGGDMDKGLRAQASVEAVVRRGNELLDSSRQRLAREQPFLCECSTIECRSTVALTAQEYLAVRANDAAFVVSPGHEVAGLDHVIALYDTYTVVEKPAL